MAKQLSHRVEVLRGLFLLFNIVFVLVGIALVAFGVYIKVNNNFSEILEKLTDVGNFKGQSLDFLAFVLIGGGVFTLLIAFGGCMGSLWHNQCLLYIYSIILAILMILELVGFIMALVYKSNLEDVYRKGLLKVFNNALNTSNTKVLDAFHDLEDLLECCGVNGIADYHGHDPSPGCFQHPDRKGCSNAIIELLRKSLPAVGGILGGVLFVELIGLIGAIVLIVALKRAPDTHYSSNPGAVLSRLIPRNRRNYTPY